MKTKILLTVIFMMTIFTSCDLYEDIFDKDEDETSFIADVSADTEYDFLVYSGKDKSYLLVKEENGLPIEAIVKPSANEEPYPVWFNDKGFPERLVIHDYILIFDNYTSTTFDFAIVSPNGEVNIAREIPITEEYLEFMRLKSASKADILKWTGHTLGVVSCALAITGGSVTTLTSLGIATPVAVGLVALGCGATAIGIAADLIGNETISEYTGLPLKTVKGFTTSMTCVTGKPLNCLVGTAGLVAGTAGYILEENEESAELAEAALAGGYGDIQVTLKWDTSADIDLYVQDPSGEMIWYGHKRSISGGWLDVDDVDGEGPENIFWDKNEAPTGTFKVYVKHYEGTYANYSVLVQAFGRSKQFSGRINPGQQISITDFSKNHLKNAEIQGFEIDLPTLQK